MDYMPETIDPAAIHAAETLAHGMSAKNGGLTIDQIFKAAGLLSSEGADCDLTPELFGHYCAMQAMGTGVGLESFGYAVRERVKLPYVEFGQYSLERDY